MLSARLYTAQFEGQKVSHEKNNIHYSQKISMCYLFLRCHIQRFNWKISKCPISNVSVTLFETKFKAKLEHNHLIRELLFISFLFCLIIPRWELFPHFILVFQFICMSWYYESKGRGKLKSHVRVSLGGASCEKNTINLVTFGQSKRTSGERNIRERLLRFAGGLSY